MKSFQLNKYEQAEYDKFLLDHGTGCVERKAYHGTIQIFDTFSFQENALGYVVHVKCICGFEENITDYDCW